MRIIRQLLAGIARKLTSLVGESLDYVKKVLRESFDFLFHCLYIIVGQAYFQRFWQFFVQGKMHEVSVLRSHSFFSPIIGFGQVENVEREGVLLKQTSEVFSCRNCILILLFVQDDVWLGLERIRDLGPEKRD